MDQEHFFMSQVNRADASVHLIEGSPHEKSVAVSVKVKTFSKSNAGIFEREWFHQAKGSPIQEGMRLRDSEWQGTVALRAACCAGLVGLGDLITT